MHSPTRTFPLRRPLNHVPPVPRWQARFPDHREKVFTAYIGVQQHAGPGTGWHQCVTNIERSLSEGLLGAPASVERFQLLGGDGAAESRVFVCYWDDEIKYQEATRRWSLTQWFYALDPSLRSTVGLWCERFTSSLTRLETNYSGTDYLPGLARLPDTTPEEHSYSAYWGAARDRIPDSAVDQFDGEAGGPMLEPVAQSTDPHWIGTNRHNLVHIRSGQYWDNCGAEEKRSYEERLEPTLRQGLSYLWEHPVETGAMGVRYLANRPCPDSPPGNVSNESCVVGFFRSLAHLEAWAKGHPSHRAIYAGALRHAKAFGAQRRFRTWHEVSVLRGGDAQWEYLNCAPGTGMMAGESGRGATATRDGH
ncbi:hem-containing dehydratase protein [Aspergillus avenaceus]|uniref:Hem-containing dehydratase protein n=1 Tax=Aspergillus avenaceus TaxID=36643 RepID=A0A5N6TTV1_ASPAV|nr:hem-containing dehydratase protein [Aspergillus avenaceus]